MKNTCPCCGHIVFKGYPGSYEICPICYWEDDDVQLADPWFEGGANKPNLYTAQKNYIRYGAMEERFVDAVKPPNRKTKHDGEWRLVQESDKSNVTSPREIESLPGKIDYRKEYYYWLK